MDKIVLAVADDEEVIHQLFQKCVNQLQEEMALEVEVVDFYNTDTLLDYCYENVDEIDALFLDIDFGRGNPQGTDALPDIREVCPKIDICMLTGMKLETKDVLGYTTTYGVEFIDKPVRSAVLSSKIANIKMHLDDFDKLKAEADENKGLVKMFEDEYEDIRNAFSEKGQQITDFMDEINNKLKSSIKKDTQTLIREIFDNLDFTPLAITEILDEKTFDKRVYKLLKTLNNNEQLSNGINKQIFPEWKITKLYEYRYSQTGRVYVQELGGGTKPLVYCIDYNHKKHNG